VPIQKEKKSKKRKEKPVAALIPPTDDIIAPDMVPTGVKLKNILNQIAVK
jgi:hypothetical protein